MGYFVFSLAAMILGVLAGMFSPFSFPQASLAYVAIIILACLDTWLGGIRSLMQKNFHLDIFIAGFFGNAFISAFLVWMGNKLNIQLSLAAVIVYGSRLFDNFSFIRRYLLKKLEK